MVHDVPFRCEPSPEHHQNAGGWDADELAADLEGAGDVAAVLDGDTDPGSRIVGAAHAQDGADVVRPLQGQANTARRAVDHQPRDRPGLAALVADDDVDGIAAAAERAALRP